MQSGGGKRPLPHVDGLHFQRTGQSTEMTRHQRRDVAAHLDSLSGRRRSSGLVQHPDRRAHAHSQGRSGRQRKRARVPRSPRRRSLERRRASQRRRSQGSLAFLRVVLPSKKLFIGQAVPVTFKAYFRAGTEVTLSGAPSLGIPGLHHQPSRGQAPAERRIHRRRTLSRRHLDRAGFGRDARSLRDPGNAAHRGALPRGFATASRGSLCRHARR